MNLEQARFNMIEQQIRPWDVLDSAVLDLLNVVRREDFVPAAHRRLAFADLELPLPEGQCMLAPKVEARMLQALGLDKHERVLEVGTGSGHLAALMAHQAQSVLSFEIRPTLAALARSQLRAAAVDGVEVRTADGAAGVPGERFDAIVLSGSVPAVPQALLDQLHLGGRLLAIVGQAPMMQALRWTRRGESAFDRELVFETVAPRLSGFPEPSAFRF